MKLRSGGGMGAQCRVVFLPLYKTFSSRSDGWLERERERERECVCIYIYIYVRICICLPLTLHDYMRGFNARANNRVCILMISRLYYTWLPGRTEYKHTCDSITRVLRQYLTSFSPSSWEFFLAFSFFVNKEKRSKILSWCFFRSVGSGKNSLYTYIEFANCWLTYGLAFLKKGENFFF